MATLLGKPKLHSSTVSAPNTWLLTGALLCSLDSSQKQVQGARGAVMQPPLPQVGVAQDCPEHPSLKPASILLNLLPLLLPAQPCLQPAPPQVTSRNQVLRCMLCPSTDKYPKWLLQTTYMSVDLCMHHQSGQVYCDNA